MVAEAVKKRKNENGNCRHLVLSASEGTSIWKGELKWQVRCYNQGAPSWDLHVSLEERPTSAHRTLALNNEQQETYSVSLHIVKSNKVKSLHL